MLFLSLRPLLSHLRIERRVNLDQIYTPDTDTLWGGVRKGKTPPNQKHSANCFGATWWRKKHYVVSACRRIFNNRSYIKSCRWGMLEEQNKLQDVKFKIRVNEQDVSSLQYKRSVVTTGYSVSNTFILNKILWLICCDTCANSNCADTVNLSEVFPFVTCYIWVAQQVCTSLHLQQLSCSLWFISTLEKELHWEESSLKQYRIFRSIRRT